MSKDIKKRKTRFKDIKKLDRIENISNRKRACNIKQRQNVQEKSKQKQEETSSNESRAIDSMTYGVREVAYQEVASAKNIYDKVSKIKKARVNTAKHRQQEESAVKKDASTPQTTNIEKTSTKEIAIQPDDQVLVSKIKTKDNYRIVNKQQIKVLDKDSEVTEYHSPSKQTSAHKIKTRDNYRTVNKGQIKVLGKDSELTEYQLPSKQTSPHKIKTRENLSHFQERYKTSRLMDKTAPIPSPSTKTKIVNNTERNIFKRLIDSFKKTTKKAVKSFKSITTLISLGASTFVFVIIIICTTSIIISSPFSIFFSNDTETEDISLRHAITEVNKEYNKRVREVREEFNNVDRSMTIINNDENLRMHDIWKDILLVYTIRTYDEEKETLYFDEQRVSRLKDVFFQIVSIEGEVEVNDEERILTICVTAKTLDELSFTTEELKIRDDLVDGKNDYLWNNILDGISIGNGSIVETALSQVGNIGGEPFWSWYGFTSRVEWCACFVSWVAEQNGFIDAGIIPKFASVHNEGMPWFKNNNQWEDGGYEPAAGDIIFFDWNDDAHGDHVGIVEKYEDGIVYTIEGNSLDDECRQRDYPVNSPYILGYGIPDY